MFGIEVTPRCDIGPGLMLPHTFGTVIGATAIGSNATVFQGATIGASSLDMGFDKNKRPVIGGNVIIGAGAKVLGGLSVGNNVTIGANSVVVKSIVDGMVVAGVPAKIIRSNGC
jgi:serine O-acetyltransferase